MANYTTELRTIVEYYGNNNEVGNAASIDDSIKKAFSINKLNEDAEQEKLEDYVRGGLEIIDEIFSGCKTYEDVANCIIDLKDRYYLD